MSCPVFGREGGKAILDTLIFIACLYVTQITNAMLKTNIRVKEANMYADFICGGSPEKETDNGRRQSMASSVNSTDMRNDS